MDEHVVNFRLFRPCISMGLIMLACFGMANAAPSTEGLGLFGAVRSGIQQANVEGVVTDASGTALVGATIQVKGTTLIATSGKEGWFSLKDVPPGATLTVQYVGYKTVEVPVGGASMRIVLESADLRLEEVVVVGYGTQRKTDLTGSISVIGASDVKKGINQSVSHALQGQASGVTVVQNSGEPGGSVEIRIRGAGSINDNSPLYVVDGIIGSINNLNPEDIESISVLKDAASAAIYGARGANGVVIVTTKKGQRNQPTSVTLNTNQGVQMPWKMPESLSAGDMVTIHREALTNDGTPSTESIWNYYNNPDNAVTRVDWFDEVFRSAYTSSQDLSISGGTDRSNFLLSLGQLTNNGIVKNTSFKRYNIRINSQHDLFKNFTLGENISLVVNDKLAAETRGDYDGVISSALFNMRNIPVWQDEEAGVYGTPSGDFPNPVASLNSRDYRTKGIDLRGNVYAEYKLLDFLSVKTDFAYALSDGKSKNFVAIANGGGRGLTENSLSELYTNGSTWIWNNTLSWDKSIDKHRISGLVGMSMEQTQNEWTSTGTAKDFSYQIESLRYFNNAGSFPDHVTGSGDDSSLLSYFGRIAYAYNDRYLLSANLRADGSSKFGPRNRWGTFPSVSAGWRVSEESFFQPLRNVVNELKIRGSWGRLGNDKIANYQYYSTVGTVSSPTLNGGIATAFAADRQANERIKWEVTTQTDLGIDFGFFNNRFTLSFDYFDKLTEDILVQAPLLSSYGVSVAPFVNAGQVSNKGFDIALGYSSDRSKEFTYRISGNIGRVKNELLSLGVSGASSIYTSDYKNTQVGRIAEGEAIGHFYVLRALGLFQTAEEIAAYRSSSGALIQPNAQPGDIKFDDVNGDGTISSNDRIVAGNSFPDLTYSLNFAATYKGFDFNMQWIGSSGNEIFNGLKLGGTLMQGTGYNNSMAILDRWTPTNTGTDVPRVSVKDLNNNRYFSTYFIEDGSFARLKYLTLGYSFSRFASTHPKLAGLRLFLTAQNLVTITGYTGFDPEVGADSGGYNSNMYGVDRGVYPQAKSFILGVNFNF